MKKIIALLLSAALCAGLLAGCGDKEQPEQEQAQQPTEEVYVSAFTPLGFPEGTSPDIWALAGEEIYAASYEKLADGQVPEGKTLDYEGQYDVMGYRLYRAAADGAVAALDYEPLPAPEDSEGRRNYSAGSYLERLFPLPDGRLLAVERLGESWYDGEEQNPESSEDYWQHVVNNDRYYFRLLDAEGRELETNPMTAEKLGTYLRMYNAVLDGDGNVCVVDDQAVYVFAPDGTQLARIETGEQAYVYNMVRLRDGRAAVEMWADGLQILAVDREGQRLEELCTLNDFAEQLLPGSGGYDFYYTVGTKLYGYLLDEQEAEEVLNWLDCDLSAYELKDVEMAGDGAILAVSQGEGELPYRVTLRKASREAVPERQLLTLGTLYPDSVSDAVLRFNRSQDRVRIQLRDYSDVFSGEDYEAGLQKLTTEIMAGNMPDLLSLDSMPYAQLAAKGLLEDLYPYLDADPELDRSDFFENVLHSMEAGGRLCEASPGFIIVTIMGPSDIVGDTPGWTYDEFDAAMAAMPEGSTAMGPGVSRENVMEMCVYLSLDDFVDWSAGSCDFENENFYRLLKFCGQFPGQDQIVYEEDGSDMSRIAEGRQLLVFASLYSMDEAVYNDQFFQGKSTYIGIPTLNGTGNVLHPSTGYAMSTSCSDKEAAWDFLRSFFTEDYQKKYSSSGELGLPLNKKAFQAALDKAMEVEYETDAEGHYLLDANGERIPAAKGGMSLVLGGEASMDFKLWAMTQEQADKLMNVIETSTKPVDMNNYLYSIIRDESAAYFAGQKSAEEVARLIQSKVNLYISEQR